MYKLSQVVYDCVVIGAGPAGVTAAIQLKRYGLSVLILEKGRIGGLLLNARKVENYLGFPDGISGADLVRRFENQLNRLKIKIARAEVKYIKNNGNFIVQTDMLQYSSKTVIVATGTKPKRAGMRGEKALEGQRLFYEVADVPEVAPGSKFLVIGGGDAAFDYALSLHDRGYVPKIMARGTVKCIPCLYDEVKRRNIEFEENAAMPDITGVGTDYVLVAAGRHPNLPPGHLEDGQNLHIVGDARLGKCRQLHISTGNALSAAIKVAEYLRSC